jgi:hypothetical protein
MPVPRNDVKLLVGQRNVFGRALLVFDIRMRYCMREHVGRRSIPMTELAMSVNAMVEWPVPHPTSSARGNGASIRANERNFAIAVVGIGVVDNVVPLFFYSLDDLR